MWKKYFRGKKLDAVIKTNLKSVKENIDQIKKI